MDSEPPMPAKHRRQRLRGKFERMCALCARERLPCQWKPSDYQSFLAEFMTDLLQGRIQTPWQREMGLTDKGEIDETLCVSTLLLTDAPKGFVRGNFHFHVPCIRGTIQLQASEDAERQKKWSEEEAFELADRAIATNATDTVYAMKQHELNDYVHCLYNTTELDALDPLFGGCAPRPRVGDTPRGDTPRTPSKTASPGVRGRAPALQLAHTALTSPDADARARAVRDFALRDCAVAECVNLEYAGGVCHLHYEPSPEFSAQRRAILVHFAASAGKIITQKQRKRKKEDQE